MPAGDPLPYDWGHVRRELQKALPSLLERLGLRNGRNREGALLGDRERMYPLNPRRNDRHAGSLVIWLNGGAAGAWRDFACGDAGDVLDLVGYVERLAGKMDVYWWALDFLGLQRGGVVRTLAAAQEERELRRREAEAEAARADAASAEKSASLARLWFDLPPIAGTPAQTYLEKARGIPLERLAKTPDALRWAGAVEWIDPEDGEVHEWRNVMIACMTRGSKITGLHRTYLMADGSGKAAIAKPKLMIGSTRGAAIRLSRGPTGLSPSKAAQAGKRGPLAIGEGIETGLTVAVARPDYRVWAAGSVAHMGLLEWPACASAIVLLRDNDWKREAIAAFEKVEQHWRGQSRGRPVEVVASSRGSDFNDLVKG